MISSVERPSELLMLLETRGNIQRCQVCPAREEAQAQEAQEQRALIRRRGVLLMISYGVVKGNTRCLRRSPSIG